MRKKRVISACVTYSVDYFIFIVYICIIGDFVYPTLYCAFLLVPVIKTLPIT